MISVICIWVFVMIICISAFQQQRNIGQQCTSSPPTTHQCEGPPLMRGGPSCKVGRGQFPHSIKLTSPPPLQPHVNTVVTAMTGTTTALLLFSSPLCRTHCMQCIHLSMYNAAIVLFHCFLGQYHAILLSLLSCKAFRHFCIKETKEKDMKTSHRDTLDGR